MMESKCNIHEVNNSIQAIEDRIQDIYSDLTKKVLAAATQKDLSFLTSLVEKKASLDEVNESLSQKANKTTVSNALSRKVNKQEMESAMEGKCDLSDLDKLIQVIETKVDFNTFDDLLRQQQYSNSYQ